MKNKELLDWLVLTGWPFLGEAHLNPPITSRELAIVYHQASGYITAEQWEQAIQLERTRARAEYDGE